MSHRFLWTIDVDLSFGTNCPVDPYSYPPARRAAQHQNSDKVPLLGAQLTRTDPLKAFLNMRAYLCGSMVNDTAHIPSLFVYERNGGVVTDSQATVFRIRGDIRFVRSRGVTSSRIVELRGRVLPPSLRLLVGALSGRLISLDHTSFPST